MPYKIVTPVVDVGIRLLCTRPYGKNGNRYSHPKGCPNFNKKKGCPLQAQIITALLDFSKPIYAIWNIFDFATHCDKMQKLHPSWTKRQVECCLYWQPKARKQLRGQIIKFLAEVENQVILKCPEANGVNLTETMASIGHILQWPPETVTYQIILAGVKNENKI